MPQPKSARESTLERKRSNVVLFDRVDARMIQQLLAKHKLTDTKKAEPKCDHTESVLRPTRAGSSIPGMASARKLVAELGHVARDRFVSGHRNTEHESDQTGDPVREVDTGERTEPREQQGLTAEVPDSIHAQKVRLQTANMVEERIDDNARPFWSPSNNFDRFLVSNSGVGASTIKSMSRQDVLGNEKTDLPPEPIDMARNRSNRPGLPVATTPFWSPCNSNTRFSVSSLGVSILLRQDDHHNSDDHDVSRKTTRRRHDRSDPAQVQTEGQDPSFKVERREQELASPSRGQAPADQTADSKEEPAHDDDGDVGESGVHCVREGSEHEAQAEVATTGGDVPATIELIIHHNDGLPVWRPLGARVSVRPPPTYRQALKHSGALRKLERAWHSFANALWLGNVLRGAQTALGLSVPVRGFFSVQGERMTVDDILHRPTQLAWAAGPLEVVARTADAEPFRLPRRMALHHSYGPDPSAPWRFVPSDRPCRLSDGSALTDSHTEEAQLRRERTAWSAAPGSLRLASTQPTDHLPDRTHFGRVPPAPGRPADKDWHRPFRPETELSPSRPPALLLANPVVTAEGLLTCDRATVERNPLLCGAWRPGRAVVRCSTSRSPPRRGKDDAWVSHLEKESSNGDAWGSRANESEEATRVTSFARQHRDLLQPRPTQHTQDDDEDEEEKDGGERNTRVVSPPSEPNGFGDSASAIAQASSSAPGDSLKDAFTSKPGADATHDARPATAVPPSTDGKLVSGKKKAMHARKTSSQHRTRTRRQGGKSGVEPGDDRSAPIKVKVKRAERRDYKADSVKAPTDQGARAAVRPDPVVPPLHLASMRLAPRVGKTAVDSTALLQTDAPVTNDAEGVDTRGGGGGEGRRGAEERKEAERHERDRRFIAEQDEHAGGGLDAAEGAAGGCCVEDEDEAWVRAHLSDAEAARAAGLI